VGLKRPVHEADRSPPTTAESRNAWIYTSTLPYVLIAQLIIGIIIIILIIIQFIYLRANIRAQRPTTKGARVEKKKSHTYKQETKARQC
jgi:H+/gluconate symporter-like permease